MKPTRLDLAVSLRMIAQFLLFSMSESIILFQNRIIWLTFVMVGAKLALDGAGVRSAVRNTSETIVAPAVAASKLARAS